MKKFILLDLDGTVSDPAVGITKSVRYSLESFGILVKNLSDLHRFIGPPLADSFMEFYGFDENKARLAVDKYREYFSATGLYENTLYPGMEAMLEALTKSGRTVVLATSKPAVYAKQILRHFSIDGYFSFVSGSELDGTRVKKAEVIGYALASCGITDKASAVMVGDREHDIIGARLAGVDSIGVLYGYGSKDELAAAGAGQIAATVDELKKLLLL